jgi:3-oxoacyl-[acyl-carrier protein] reductase
LDGKVAVVTGAGRGLGRAEALELARLGARVVVNDFESGPAEEVVEEIKAAGGEAAANQADVADWDASKAMIRQAVDQFGGLDILVNNAGFLRDRMIFNMSEEEWDAVIRVHLKGHFCPMRHAAEYWREQGKASGKVYGRVINTSSEAGITGSPGQPNYSAAKGGIIQLTLSMAQGLGKYGVNANAILPRAKTRMTENMEFFHENRDGWDVFAPENVSPLVAYLASPDAERVSGQAFVVYGKMITVLDAPTFAHRFDADSPWTPDSVSDTLTPFYEKREPISDGFRARLNA